MSAFWNDDDDSDDEDEDEAAEAAWASRGANAFYRQVSAEQEAAKAAPKAKPAPRVQLNPARLRALAGGKAARRRRAAAAAAPPVSVTVALPSGACVGHLVGRRPRAAGIRRVPRAAGLRHPPQLLPVLGDGHGAAGPVAGARPRRGRGRAGRVRGPPAGVDHAVRPP